MDQLMKMENLHTVDFYDKYGCVILPKSFKLYNKSWDTFDINKTETYNFTLFCFI